MVEIVTLSLQGCFFYCFYNFCGLNGCSWAKWDSWFPPVETSSPDKTTTQLARGSSSVIFRICGDSHKHFSGDIMKRALECSSMDSEICPLKFIYVFTAECCSCLSENGYVATEWRARFVINSVISVEVASDLHWCIFSANQVVFLLWSQM